MAVARSSYLIRFGVFEVDLRVRELRKQGLKLKLPEQSFQILAMLLEHPGELVIRVCPDCGSWRAAWYSTTKDPTSIPEKSEVT